MTDTSASLLEQESGSYVYIFHIAGTDLYKIGQTGFPEQRRKDLACSWSRRVDEISKKWVSDPTALEYHLHAKFAHASARIPSTYSIQGRTELFVFTQQDLASVKEELDAKPTLRPGTISKDPDYRTTSILIRKTTIAAVKKLLIGRDQGFNALMQELLSRWVKEQG